MYNYKKMNNNNNTKAIAHLQRSLAILDRMHKLNIVHKVPHKSFGDGNKWRCVEPGEVVIDVLSPAKLHYTEPFEDHIGLIHTIPLKQAVEQNTTHSQRIRDKILGELEVLRKISRECKNLMKLEKFIISQSRLVIGYEHVDNVVSLYDYLATATQLDAEVSHATAIHIAHEIANGLLALHKESLFHGKLELQNICVAPTEMFPVVKLFNIELKSTEGHVITSYDRLPFKRHTYMVLSKEEVTHDDYAEIDQRAIDMHRLGMIIYYITHPRYQRKWEDLDGGTVMQKLEADEKPPITLGTTDNVTLDEKVLKDVITACIDHVPEYRPTSEYVVKLLSRYHQNKKRAHSRLNPRRTSKGPLGSFQFLHIS